MSEYDVSLSDALAMLDVIPDYDSGGGPKPCVHTVVQAGGIMIGAHWSVESLRDLMRDRGVQRAGAAARASGHGLVVVRPSPEGPLFIATKETIAA